MLPSVHSCQKSNLPIYQFKNKTLLTSDCQLFIIQSLFPYLLNFQDWKTSKLIFISWNIKGMSCTWVYMGPQWICLSFMQELFLWCGLWTVNFRIQGGNQFNCVILLLLPTVAEPESKNQEDDDPKKKSNGPKDDGGGIDDRNYLLFHLCGVHALLSICETPGDITVVPGVAHASVAPHCFL